MPTKSNGSLLQTSLLADEPAKAQERRKPERHASGLISSLWEFEGSKRGAPGSFYRWYGTLPEELIERLCDLYMPPDGAIADSFLGTGSTLRVAKRRGYSGVGLDSNPIACRISRLRINPIALQAEALVLVGRAVSAPAAKPQLFAEFKQKYPYTTRWFNPENLRVVINILAAVSKLDEDAFSLATMAIASAARDIANVNTRCTHHLVFEEKGPLPLARVIMERLRLILLDELAGDVSPTEAIPATQRILNRSARETGLENRAFDLTLLHPPYLGVIHYHNIHRIAIDLLHFADHIRGMTQSQYGYDTVRDLDLSTDHEARYHAAMEAVLDEASRITRESGTIVLIMGDHRYKGRLRHPITRLTVDLENRGWLLHERFIWMLNNNSGMHVKRKGNYIDHNYICVFRRSK